MDGIVWLRGTATLVLWRVQQGVCGQLKRIRGVCLFHSLQFCSLRSESHGPV